MRLASLASRGPDGTLVVEEDGLRSAGAGTMRAWLDGADLAPSARVEPVAGDALLAPLPRTHTFLDGSAYVNHVDLVRRARGAEMPARFWTDPLMYQGCAVFDAPTAPITGDAAWGIDFEGEVAVVTGDVPRGATPDEGAAAIRLVMLLNDVSLRALIPDELSKGFGFVQSKPPSALAPFAVTPDDLPGWDGRRLHATLCVDLNGAPFGRTRSGEDMTFDFGQLVAHAARTRPLPAGTVIGSGTVSNRDEGGGPGRTVAAGARGYSCIAEQRMVETLTDGAAQTPFLASGDRVEMWMEDAEGRDLFGRIVQNVETT
ncbi:fumarylacetoacetate hydrolase family protein [uncultured Jannaschia sp.]|uniref:fumarylacetoacetate hydrolase family protein n=1 Tax=uncultured Jannaschia sp. TaxID=293347 RepID=UPI0026343BEF|nr:fumarylacetoacetate hydrolase family protein [uncultured Jannaschia sp.]